MVDRKVPVAGNSDDGKEPGNRRIARVAVRSVLGGRVLLCRGDNAGPAVAVPVVLDGLHGAREVELRDGVDLLGELFVRDLLASVER